MSNKGYDQAIQNVAYYTIQFSERDFSPFGPDMPDTDVLMDYVANNPEIANDWQGLEDAVDVIMSTYGVSYETVMIDVWNSMMEQDPDIPKTLN